MCADNLHMFIVINFVESFTEIHYNYICLITIFKVVIDLLRKTDKLRFTTVFRTEAMLVLA